MDDFYDQAAPFYHLIYRDWEASIARQGRQLAELIRTRWGSGCSTVLDVACGIGTQSLGLASLGFEVTGSDLSAAAVERARREAESRGLDIAFSVCDMRQVGEHHPGGFDVVLCADNSIPHLLNDEEIRSALSSMRSRLRVGGGLILTVRDYDREERGRGLVKPYGTRDVEGKRYLLWQVWDFEGDGYDLSMYFVEDDGTSEEAEDRERR